MTADGDCEPAPPWPAWLNQLAMNTPPGLLPTPGLLPNTATSPAAHELPPPPPPPVYVYIAAPLPPPNQPAPPPPLPPLPGQATPPIWKLAVQAPLGAAQRLPPMPAPPALALPAMPSCVQPV